MEKPNKEMSQEEESKAIFRMAEIRKKPEEERSAEEILEMRNLFDKVKNYRIQQDPEGFFEVVNAMLNGKDLDLSSPANPIFQKKRRRTNWN